MDFLDNALTSSNPAHIKSIQKSIVLMELLAKENRPMSLKEISLWLGWPKSTLHGILTTLRDFQLINQSMETSNYTLGVRFFELGNIVAKQWSICEIAHPFMQDLSINTGFTVHLGKELNGEILYLEKVEANSMLKIVSEVGSRLPIHCSGLGKVILAHMDASQVNKIIKQRGLKKFTKNTIDNKSQLNKELELIRNRGYAIDDNEIMEGLKCVAFGIKDWNGDIKHAISVSGLSNQLDGDRLKRVIRALRGTVENIESSLLNRSY